MGADRETLQLEIDANGMVTGRKVAVRQLEDIEKASAKAGTGVGKFEGLLARASKGLSMFAGGVALAGSLLAGLAGGWLLRTIQTYENLSARLVTVTGDQAKANAVFGDLEKFAAKTPFQLTEITDAYIALATQGIYPTTKQLEGFGNVAAAMGGNIVDFARAVTRATVGEFESLKTFGIQGRVVGDQIAFTFKGVRTLVERDSAAIVKFLSNIGNTDFAGGMERQAQTLGGAFSNLEDSASSLGAKVGQGGLSREVATLAREFSNASAEGETWATRLGQGLGAVVGSLQPLGLGVVGVVNVVGAAVAAIGASVVMTVALIADGAARLLEAGGFEEKAKSMRSVAASIRDFGQVGIDFATTSANQAKAAFSGMAKSFGDLGARLTQAPSVLAATTGGIDDLANSNNRAADSAGKLNDKLAQAFSDALDTASPLLKVTREYSEASRALAAGWDSKRGGLNEYLALQRGLLEVYQKQTAELRAQGVVVDALGPNDFRASGGSLIDLTKTARNLREEQTQRLGVWSEEKQRIADVNDEVNTFRAGLVAAGLSQKVINDLTDEYRRKLGLLPADLKQAVTPLASLSDSLKQNSQLVGDMLVDLATRGKSAFRDMWDYWKQQAFRAIAAAAVRMAALKLADASTGKKSSASDYQDAAGAVGKAWQWYKGAGGSWANLAGAAAVAAIVAYGMYSQKRTSERMYGAGTGAANTYGPGIIWGGGVGKIGTQFGEGLASILDAIQQTTGQLFRVLPNTVAMIRNDGEWFRVFVNNELIGSFKNINEATLAAAKAAFAKSNLAGVLDPVISSAIKLYQGKVEDFAAYINEIQSALDRARGLSDLAIAIRNLDIAAANLTATLLKAGMGYQEARRLALQDQIRSMMDLRRQITGEPISKEEQIAAQRADAALWNAKFILLKAEVQLERDRLASRIAILQSGVRVAQVQTNLERDILRQEIDHTRIRAGVAKANVEIQAAALEAMISQLAQFDAILADLGKITLIDLDKLKGLGGGFGKHVDRFGNLVDMWNDGIRTFRDAVLGARTNAATTALAPRDALKQLYGQFMTTFQSAQGGNVTALQELPQLYTSLLAMAKSYSGGGGGLDFLGRGASFADFFRSIDAMASAFLTGKMPTKLTEKNVVFDMRFYQSQRDQLEVSRKHQAIAKEQASQQHAELKQAVSELKRIASAVEKQASAEPEMRKAG